MAFDLNTKSIYDIFRSCRLCGAGGGYKMPIIPSVVGIECPDIELRQKIRECVQIEVNQDDKMPPLICEFCVDKVNDFYEFLEMCRETNKKTRLQLNLPPQMMPQGIPDAGDCILGVTEQITFASTPPPLAEPSTPRPRLIKVKSVEKLKNIQSFDKRKENDKRVKGLRKEMESLIQKESSQTSSTRSSRQQKDRDTSLSSNDSRPSSRARSPKEENVSLSRIRSQDQPRNKDTSKSKGPSRNVSSVIEIDSDDDENELLSTTRLKRSRDKTENENTPPKKPRLLLKPPLRLPSPPPPRAGPKSMKAGPKSMKEELKLKEEPKSMKSGPKSMKAGPKSLKEEPKEEPKSTKPGPKSSKAGPKSKEDPKSLQENPKSTKAGPKSTKEESKEESKSMKAGPKSSKAGPKSMTSRPHERRLAGILLPPPVNEEKSSLPGCNICWQTFKGLQGLSAHLKTHTPTFTPNSLACNSCGCWFETPAQVASHHNEHKLNRKAYFCHGCKHRFYKKNSYDEHIEEFKCVPYTEVADIECDVCRKKFPTKVLFNLHKSKCEPMVKCGKCDKMYTSMKYKRKHEMKCTGKETKSEDIKVAPEVRKRLMTAQIKMTKCDKALLKIKKGKRYNVREVALDFDLDKRSVYPYRSLIKVKQEPLFFDKMVSINKDIQNEFYREEDYVHWDSDLSSDSDEEYSLVNPTEKIKRVPTLTTLSLKTIFSRRCLGKVPRKLRKVKEKFDAFNDFDQSDFNINSLIDNLGNDDTNFSGNNDFNTDSLLGLSRNVTFDDEKNESGFNDANNGIVTNKNNDDGNETDASLNDNVNKKDDANTVSDISQDLCLNLDLPKDGSRNGDLSNFDKDNGVLRVDENNEIDRNNVNEELNEIVNNVIKEINEIGNVNDMSRKVNGDTSQNSDFIDEGQLLADLDVQIGEKGMGDGDSSEKDKDITLEDLLPKSDNVLDDISQGEFSGDVV